MTREQQLGKARRDGRTSASRTMAVRPMEGQRSARRGQAPGKRGSRLLKPAASRPNSKSVAMPVANLEFYRPLKKPITLRLDADVLAWFKKEGRRYQTRINQALRQVMAKEMKKAS